VRWGGGWVLYAPLLGYGQSEMAWSYITPAPPVPLKGVKRRVLLFSMSVVSTPVSFIIRDRPLVRGNPNPFTDARAFNVARAQ
jgi:hypothetical protein